MGELTKEQLAKLSNTALGFYKAMGLSGKKTTQNGEVLDLYRVIGIMPEFDEDGQRRLTPYEILGVPPQFRDGVNETPIVFAIKNRVQKIGKYTGEELNFIYKDNRVREEDTLLETLKAGYKRAIMMGDDEEAAKYLDLIDKVSKGGASDFLSSFYDYTKYYKRLKKQLLIDIFAHFFLMYMTVKSITIQPGIIRGQKVYKPFKEKVQEDELGESEYVDDRNVVYGTPPVPEFPDISQIVIQVPEEMNEPVLPPPSPKIKKINENMRKINAKFHAPKNLGMFKKQESQILDSMQREIDIEAEMAKLSRLEERFVELTDYILNQGKNPFIKELEGDNMVKESLEHAKTVLKPEAESSSEKEEKEKNLGNENQQSGLGFQV